MINNVVGNDGIIEQVVNQDERNDPVDIIYYVEDPLMVIPNVVQNGANLNQPLLERRARIIREEVNNEFWVNGLQQFDERDGFRNEPGLDENQMFDALDDLILHDHNRIAEQQHNHDHHEII